MPVQPVGSYKVGKSFLCEGVLLESGTVVDVTGWRNARILIERRYLIPMRTPTTVDSESVGDVPDRGCPKCGAVADEPCHTPSGKVATSNHAGRN